MVPRRGLEPPSPYGHLVLNQARLPIPPPRQELLSILSRPALGLKKDLSPADPAIDKSALSA